MALDQYSKTNWTPSMPITAERMNNAEQGIKVNRDAIIELDSSVNTLQNSNFVTIQQVDNKIETVSGGISAAQAQIAGALNGYQTLGARLNALDAMDQSLLAMFGQVSDPSNPSQYIPAFSSTNTVYAAIKAITDSFGTAPGSTSPAYNSSNTIYNAINNMSTEVANARNDGINHQTYVSLFDHLNAMHSSINTVSSNVSDIFNSTGLDSENHPVPFVTRMTQFIIMKYRLRLVKGQKMEVVML